MDKPDLTEEEKRRLKDVIGFDAYQHILDILKWKKEENIQRLIQEDDKSKADEYRGKIAAYSELPRIIESFSR